MADALASGASVRKDVGVRVPPRAPHFRLVGLVTQVNAFGVARIGHAGCNTF